MSQKWPPRVRARNACFTYFFSPEDIKQNMLGMPLFDDDSMKLIKYWIAQRERTKDGKLHLQGYMEFTTQMTLSKAKNILDAHWEPRMGSQKQAIDYCKKAASRDCESFANGELIDAGPWEEGTANQQGKRNDINQVVDLLKKGATDAELIEHVPSYVLRYHKNLSVMRTALQPKSLPTRKVQVLVIWGEPRVGKSRYARQLDPSLFKVWSPTAQWFDGYNDQKTILFDEFCGKPPIETMNELLDVYGLIIPTKGGTIIAKWDRVIIISNINPKEWYCGEAAIKQTAFRERLGRIHYMDGEGRLGPNTGSANPTDKLPDPAWTPLMGKTDLYAEPFVRESDNDTKTIVKAPPSRTESRTASPTPSLPESTQSDDTEYRRANNLADMSCLDQYLDTLG